MFHSSRSWYPRLAEEENKDKNGKEKDEEGEEEIIDNNNMSKKIYAAYWKTSEQHAHQIICTNDFELCKAWA